MFFVCCYWHITHITHITLSPLTWCALRTVVTVVTLWGDVWVWWVGSGSGSQEEWSVELVQSWGGRHSVWWILPAQHAVRDGAWVHWVHWVPEWVPQSGLGRLRTALGGGQSQTSVQNRSVSSPSFPGQNKCQPILFFNFYFLCLSNWSSLLPWLYLMLTVTGVWKIDKENIVNISFVLWVQYVIFFIVIFQYSKVLEKHNW